MAYVIEMPQMGLEMEQGTVVEWAVDLNKTVSAGETIAVVESEKAVADVTARERGAVRKVFVDRGESAGPTAPLGVFGKRNENVDELVEGVTQEL